MVTDFLFVCITFSLACIGHSQPECKKHVDSPQYYCDPNQNLLYGYSSDLNGRVELNCSKDERSIEAMFKSDNVDLRNSDSAFILNCSNETHFEISSYCRSVVISDSNKPVNISFHLLGAVSCTVFGCYSHFQEKIMFYSLNSTGQNCYFPEIGDNTPSETAIASTSSVQLVMPTSATVAPIVSVTSLTMTTLSRGTPSVGAIASTSSVQLVMPTSATVAPIVSVTSVRVTTTTLSKIGGTPSVGAIASTSSSVPTHETVTLVTDMVALYTLMVIFIVVILTVCMIGILSAARWRKNKFMLNLRTGYGLQANVKQVYKPITDAMLNMKLPTATSTLTIFDPFNYNSSSESVGTENSRSDFDLNHDIRNQVEAMIIAAHNESVGSSYQTEAQGNELYISSQSIDYLRNGQEFSTQKWKSDHDINTAATTYIQALTTHVSEPYLIHKKDKPENSKSQDYVTALRYTSNEALSENDCSLLEDYPFNNGHQLSSHSFSNGITRSVSSQNMSNLSNGHGYVYV